MSSILIKNNSPELKNNERIDGQYYDGKIETIEYLEYMSECLSKNGVESKKAFCILMALKYLSARLGAKNETPIDLDLKKAENYIHRAIYGEWIIPKNK